MINYNKIYFNSTNAIINAPKFWTKQQQEKQHKKNTKNEEYKKMLKNIFDPKHDAIDSTVTISGQPKKKINDVVNNTDNKLNNYYTLNTSDFGSGGVLKSRLAPDYRVDTRVFGALNENEYSASIFFNRPKLPLCLQFKNEKGQMENIIGHRVRTYCKKKVPIYYDGSRLSTKYVQSSENEDVREVLAECIARFDFNLNASHQNEEVYKSTIKMRIVRQKIPFKGMMLTATGAIETPLKLESIDTMRSIVGATKREFVYWHLNISWIDGNVYKFRIAFRHTLQDEKTTDIDDFQIKGDVIFSSDNCECNVECEDDINCETFGEIFYALFRYYQFMYETNDKKITPIDDFGLFTKSKYTVDLTDAQTFALSTIELTSLEENDDEPSSNIDDNFKNFLKYIGLSIFVENTDEDIVSECIKNVC